MKRIGAFFDLDRTLIEGHSGSVFLKDLRARGEISWLKLVHAMSWIARYHFSVLDLPALAGRVANTFSGKSEPEFAAQCRKLVNEQLLPRLFPTGLRAIDDHRKKGHLLAILSTSPNYLVNPVAEKLRLDVTGSTALAVKDGLFTGTLDGPVCFGHGKVEAAEMMRERYDIDLDNSYFYTDSYSDLPMLERVGNPVVVNPDPRLKREASKRKWPVMNWELNS